MRTLLITALLLAAAPLGAVSSLTVNGQTSGSFATPTDLVLRASCNGGERVTFLLVVDADADGQTDAGERVLLALPVKDSTGAADRTADENAAAGQVTFTYRLGRSTVHGPIVVRAIDSTDGAAEHGFQLTDPNLSQHLAGRVFGPAGNGLAGIMVYAETPPDHSFHAVTGADGSWEIDVPAGTVGVMVDGGSIGGGSSFPRYALNVTAGVSVEALNFQVVPAGPYTISGHLAGGPTPVPACAVQAQQGSSVFWTLSDAFGDYSLAVPGGTYVVTFYPPSGWTASPAVWANIVVPPSQTLDLATMTRLTGAIAGRVLAGTTPVPGASVQGFGGGYSLSGASNAAGWYQLWPPAGAGTYQVYAVCPGYSMLMNDVREWTAGSTAADLPVAANQYTVSGTVTSGGGLPAWVSVMDLDSSWIGSWGAATNAAGAYSVALPAGTWQLQPYAYVGGAWLAAQTAETPPNQTRNFSTGTPGAAATLTSGMVTPPAAAPGATFTYAVTYTDGTVGHRVPEAVCVYVDGVPWQMRPVDSSDTDPTDGIAYTLTYAGPPLAVGAHTYRFAATGNMLSTVFTSQANGPTVDANAPSVTISPTGGTFSGVVAITATASDPQGINRVEFRVDGVPKSTDTTAPYSYNWDSYPAGVPDGSHTLRATAYDNGTGFAYAEATITTDNTTFDDVPKTSGQWAYVEAMAREGITAGCQQTPVRLYCPDSAVTRGQMAVFLCRAAGWSTLNPATPSFADVPPTNPQYGYIERLKAEGVTGGCGGGNYCPNSPVTRGQMAVFLCRAAGVPTQNPATPTFTDVPSTNPQYVYIEGMLTAGITAGCSQVPKKYCPDSPVTRGQMAVFLCRAFAISTTP